MTEGSGIYNISVVIPLFNKKNHIRRALDSILAQTWQRFEVIVVDDGSTDGGGEIVKDDPDTRIRLVQKPNGGPSSARNTGIRNANYDLIAFLDADDTWMPAFLETIVSLAAKYPDAGACATGYFFNDGNRIIKKKFRDSVLPPGWEGLLDSKVFFGYGTPFNMSCSAIKKSAFQMVGTFDEKMRFSEDTHLWRRLILLSTIAYRNEPLAEVFLNAENRSGFEQNYNSDNYRYLELGFPEVLQFAEKQDCETRQKIFRSVEEARAILRKNQSLLRPPHLIRQFYDLSDHYRPDDRGRKILKDMLWARMVLAVWKYRQVKLATRALFTARIFWWMIKGIRKIFSKKTI